MNDPIRLSKRLIELIGCSRREAELYIEGGWVTVDGQVIDEPQFKVQEQQVSLLPNAVASPLEPATLLLHKPAAFKGSIEQLIRSLNADNHWDQDPSEQPVLKGHFARLQSELPLQQGASGLLVLSQDWRTLRKLTADANKLEQEYIVQAQGELSPAILDRLKRGLIIKGQSYPACRVSWQNEEHLRIAIKHPSENLIHELCHALGLRIGGVKRLRIGGVAMGKLPVGQWRYLRANERF